MGWSGQTWVACIQEGSGGQNYGVFNTNPGPGQLIYPSMYTDNAFTARDMPQRQVIRTADAGNRRREEVASRHVFQGTFNTLMRPDEAAYWLTAATGLLADSNGHIFLPSYSWEFYDSIQAWRFLGGECQSLTLTSTAMQDYCSLSMNWIFQQRDVSFTSFTQPPESVYSVVSPYKHIETAGHCTMNGVTISKYQNMNITVNNVMTPTWDELPYISYLYYCGRDLDFTMTPQYLSRANRDSFGQQTPMSFILQWSRTTPGHSLQINCQTNSYFASLEDQLPLGGAGYQAINVQVFYDPPNTTDFNLTVS